jgi:hypothetical protein
MRTRSRKGMTRNASTILVCYNCNQIRGCSFIYIHFLNIRLNTEADNNVSMITSLLVASTTKEMTDASFF